MAEPIHPEVTGHPCPKCGAPVSVYVDRYFGRVQCPKCGETFSRKELPDEVPVKRVKKPKKPEEERRVSRKRRREEEPGLFKRAKTASEVLEDVLADHSLKNDFIDYAVKRSKRFGGIHPNELWNMLGDMSSGVKSKSHIKYIVDDYYYALQKEQEMARQTGSRISYPLRFGREAETGGPYPTRLGYEEPAPMYPEQYSRSRGGYASTRGYRQAFGYREPPLTKEDIDEIFERRIEAKEKRDELTKLRDKVESLPKQVQGMIEKSIESLKPKTPETPPNVVTKEEFMKSMSEMMDKTTKTMTESLKERDTNAYIKYLEAHSSDMKSMQDKTLNTLVEERKEWSKERTEILRKIEEGRRIPPSTEGYSRDETKLIADIGSRALETRGALIDKAGSILIKFIPPEAGPPPKREKVGGETTIYDLVPKELQD